MDEEKLNGADACLPVKGKESVCVCTPVVGELSVLAVISLGGRGTLHTPAHTYLSHTGPPPITLRA